MSKEGTKASGAVLARVMKWCALRDRTEREAAVKLREVAEKAGVAIAEDDVLVCLDELRAGSYLDDARCAESYVRAHAMHKGWGPLKIRAGLLGRGVPESVAHAALDVWDERHWLDAAERLLRKRASDLATNRDRVIRWMLGRGFPQHVVLAALRRL